MKASLDFSPPRLETDRKRNCPNSKIDISSDSHPHRWAPERQIIGNSPIAPYKCCAAHYKLSYCAMQWYSPVFRSWAGGDAGRSGTPSSPPSTRRGTQRGTCARTASRASARALPPQPPGRRPRHEESMGLPFRCFSKRLSISYLFLLLLDSCVCLFLYVLPAQLPSEQISIALALADSALEILA